MPASWPRASTAARCRLTLNCLPACTPCADAELAAQVQGPPKSINRGATRFPRELQPSASATPTTSSAGGGSGGAAAAGGVAAAGAAGRPAAAAGVAGTRGYDILATPSFDPGAGGETPFMTWGEIEGTPMRIEAEDLPPGPMMEGGCCGGWGLRTHSEGRCGLTRALLQAGGLPDCVVPSAAA